MEQKYDSLEEIFKNPPNEFRMMPFWFWNHEMIEKETTRQIQDHHDHGIGGEFIHPRHGRLTPYMGQRWLENVEAAADKCKELDMPCFLYDEDNWPSGPAGGYITGPYHPENRGKFVVMFDENNFEGGQSVQYKLDWQNVALETQLLAAVAVPNPTHYPDFSDVIEQQIDVTEFVNGNEFQWTVPEGEWLVQFYCVVVNPYNSNLNGYIDILRKETVKDFIDFTHKKYVDWFISKGKQDYLGTIVPGIFTDEPAMTHMSVVAANMMKWFIFTPEMPQKFQEMFGYNFNSILISMTHDTGPISAKHRCNYWDCVIELYTHAFYKQIYDYCDQYGLRFTGHVNSEGTFPSNVKNHGDYFKVFQYMHYGGVDQLCEDVRPDDLEEIWNLEKNPYSGMANEMVVASKLASSVAHLLGKPRVLVEAFGTSSWDITMASAKRVNDFLISTGCDLFVPHSFNISEDGYRKGDHPAAFNYQPYYKNWKALADHNGRLCSILNAHSGVLVPEVLYLYASRTFHAEMDPNQSEMANMIGTFFNHNADCFMRQQIDFEFANEDMIIESQMENGKITIRDESFKVLMLGATTCVSLKFAQFVKQYYESGGKILACLGLPYKESNTGESEEVAQIFESIFGINPKDQWTKTRAEKDLSIEIIENHNDAGGLAVFIQAPFKTPFMGPYYPQFEDACRRVLPLQDRGVVLWKDEAMQKHPAYILVTHKHFADREIYFIANTSRTANYEKLKVILNCCPEKIERWDTLTGEIQPYSCYAIENGKPVLTLDFPPYESDLFVVYPAADPSTVLDQESPMIGMHTSAELVDTIPFEDEWQCKLNDLNGAMLYLNWKSSYKVEAIHNWNYLRTIEFTHKFMVNDLDAIKPVKLVIDGLIGDYGWCKTTIDMPVGGDRAHQPFPSNVEVQINGKNLSFGFDFTPKYLDAYWPVADLSKLLNEGENEIKMICTSHNHGTFHVVTDPWRLVGNFEVDESEGIPKLQKPRSSVQLGDLTTQGYPRYFGGFSYIQDLDVPAECEGKRLKLLIADTTDCVEVKINGELCDVCWNNWEINVTNFVKSGQKNTFELIYYGIAQNMLQTNIFPQGLHGKISLNVYHE